MVMGGDIFTLEGLGIVLMAAGWVWQLVAIWQKGTTVLQDLFLVCQVGGAILVALGSFASGFVGSALFAALMGFAAAVSFWRIHQLSCDE